MLLNPYSSVTEMIPWSEAHWTPHWMAVQLTILDETVLVVNVYGVSVKTELESLFESDLLLLQEYDEPMFIGGDFDCTLEPRLDRSFISPPGRHDSLALRRLLGRAQLGDVLDADMEIDEEKRALLEFQAAAHIYFYTLSGGNSASSRLDRWYVSYRHTAWIRDVAKSVPGHAADLEDISIRIGVPRHVVRVRKPRRVYPVPGLAHAAAHKAIMAVIALDHLQPDAISSVPTSDYTTVRSLFD